MTAAILNTHIRDQLVYIKGIPDGTSLQDVTIADARAFKHGTYAVERRVNGSKGHVEGGLANTGSTSTNGTYRVNFADAFSSAPNVVLAPSGGGGYHVWVTGIDTTGFTFNWTAGDSGTVKTGYWLAEGPD